MVFSRHNFWTFPNHRWIEAEWFEQVSNLLLNIVLEGVNMQRSGAIITQLHMTQSLSNDIDITEIEQKKPWKRMLDVILRENPENKQKKLRQTSKKNPKINLSKNSGRNQRNFCKKRKSKRIQRKSCVMNTIHSRKIFGKNVRIILRISVGLFVWFYFQQTFVWFSIISVCTFEGISGGIQKTLWRNSSCDSWTNPQRNS